MRNRFFLITLSLLLISLSTQAQKTGSFIDIRDNTTYKTVEIGTQIWMAENLNLETNYSWCYNDSVKYCNIYGRLYNWQAAKNACPIGWHLPSMQEWTTMITYIGGEAIAGGKLKTTTGYEVPNEGATDSIGFSGKAGGFRNEDGTYNYKGFIGYWWTTKPFDSYAYYFYLGFKSKYIFSTMSWKENGLSVRCVKD